MNAIRTAYIVFDIETIPDGKLLSEVLYPGEDIAEEEAIARQEQEVLERTGGRSSFSMKIAPILFCIRACRSSCADGGTRTWMVYLPFSRLTLTVPGVKVMELAKIT